MYIFKACVAGSTLINVNPDEYKQSMRYYPFMVNLYIFNGSCNTLDDLSSRIYVPNKIEDLNLSVFNMITRINKNINKTNIMQM